MNKYIFLLDRTAFTGCFTFLFWFVTWFLGSILVGAGWFKTLMLFEMYGFAIGLIYGLYIVNKTWKDKEDLLMIDVLNMLTLR